MPVIGDIVYAVTTEGVLEPVLVKDIEDAARTSADGQAFSDMRLTVENNKGRCYTGYAFQFEVVPYLPEIERELANNPH
jgi:hypothetical protein